MIVSVPSVPHIPQLNYNPRNSLILSLQGKPKPRWNPLSPSRDLRVRYIDQIIFDYCRNNLISSAGKKLTWSERQALAKKQAEEEEARSKAASHTPSAPSITSARAFGAGAAVAAGVGVGVGAAAFAASASTPPPPAPPRPPAPPVQQQEEEEEEEPWTPVSSKLVYELL